MARYIDANELLSELVKLKGRVSYANLYDEEYPVTQGVCIGLNNAIEALQTMPTVDVAPKGEVALDVIRKVKNKVRKYKHNAVNPYEEIMMYLNELEKKYLEGE